MSGPQNLHDETNKLEIEISPERRGGFIGMSRTSEGLVVLQRLVSKAAIQEDPHDSLLGRYDRKQVTSMVQFNITDASFASVKLVAEPSGPPAVASPTLPFSVNPAQDLVNGFFTALGGLLAKSLFDKVNNLRKGINPFKPNDATRRYLEELAATARRGGLIYSFRWGKMTCFIDKTTDEQLKKLKKKRYGRPTPYSGMVIGSSMKRHYIDITIDQFAADVACEYAKKLEPVFGEFTQIKTIVQFVGRPVWEGTDQPVGTPQSIKLERMVKVGGSNPTNGLRSPVLLPLTDPGTQTS